MTESNEVAKKESRIVTPSGLQKEKPMGHWIEICNTEYGVVAVDGVIHTEPGPGRAEISAEVAEFCRQNSVAGKYCEVRGHDIVGFNLLSQAPSFDKEQARPTLRRIEKEKCMADQNNHPRMPLKYRDLIPEIKTLLREDSSMDRAEIKRRIMEDRNLPTDMSDPYWDERGPSHRGRRTVRRTMFNGRFGQAYRAVRPSK